MYKNNKKGAVSGLVIGIVVIVALIGIGTVVFKGDDVVMEQNQDVFVGGGQNEVMQEKEGEAMADSTESINSPQAGSGQLAVGSYEDYSPEKLAKATATNGDTVIFFHASWCPTCNTHEKNILSNIEDLPDGLTILKADYDKETSLKQKYGVRFQHSFVQVDSSGAVIAQWANGRTIADITSKLQ